MTPTPAPEPQPAEVVIEDARWRAANLARLAQPACVATLAHCGLDPAAWEIGVLGCDDARIAVLNGDFRETAEPTNVLSWPSGDRAAAAPGGRPAPPDPAAAGLDPGLGDIALAFETCAREAAEAGLTLSQHVTHLVVHATLHLLGYDHDREEDADLMEATEAEILASLGIADPYSPPGPR